MPASPPFFNAISLVHWVNKEKACRAGLNKDGLNKDGLKFMGLPKFDDQSLCEEGGGRRPDPRKPQISNPGITVLF